jgi:hypothetical protein
VTGDTRVNTPLGEKTIDYLLIKYGSEKFPILNYDGKIIESDMAFITATGVKPVYTIKFTDGFSIRMTSDHRILIDALFPTYRPLSDLNAGDDVVCAKGLQVIYRKITEKIPSGECEVYDLTADKNHNFIANSIIVHNCAVIIDEANIGRKVKAVHEKNQLTDRTEAIYQAVKRRIRTTFMKQGRPPTLLMTIGSRRYPSDFVERRIRELQNDKNALCRDLDLWTARGLENFSPKMFKVLVGNDTVQSRVLAEGEPPPQGMQIITVPYDFYKDFVDDCDGALRDIGGISVRTLSPYFSNQKLLREMFDEGRSHPCRTVEWRIDEHLDVQWEKITQIVGGKMQPILFPDKARCVSIDLGRTKNPTGFSIGFVKGFKTVERKQPDGRIYHENLPYIMVEFTLRISPVAGEEVKFWQVRELLFKFIEHGIPIKYAVMDHWQSDDFAQLLTEQGIETTKIKTDINAYETLKNAVYEGRIRTYPYKPLLDELSMLEYDAKKMKVDTAVEDFGNIHHDVADSVCLLVNRLSKGFRAQDFSPVSPETDYVKPQGENGPYQTVGIGETPFELLPGEKSAMQENAQPEPTQAFPSYGLMFNGKETGWGDEVNPKTPQGYVPVSKQPMIRLEVLAQEFCTRIGIDKLPTVTVDSIKAFLFEKQLTDHRYVNAIKSHIERVYVDKLGGKTI